MTGSVYGTQNTVDIGVIQGVLTDLQWQAGYRNVLASNYPAVVNFDPVSGLPTFTAQTPNGMISTPVANNWNLIPNLVGDGSTVNSNAMIACIGVGGTVDTLGLTGATVQQQGVYRTGFINAHPRADLVMNGRGSVIFQAKPSMLATNPSGAPNSVFCVERIAPVNTVGGLYLAYVTVYEGFTLDGSTTQTNPIIGIRCPDPNPADNPFDPDPTYTTNKDYTAVKLHNVEIQNMSGTGYLMEKGNGRAHLFDSRALQCQGNGVEFHTNDIIIGERCGFGGNAGFGVWCGQGSGLFMGQTNLWGSAANRSLTCGAFYTQGTLTGITNCEFNDWAFFDGTHGGSSVRAGTMSGNCMAPHNEVFSADGVAIDVTSSGDERLQAQISVSGYQGFVFGPQLFTRSTAVPFPTPNNIGGALDGSAGTAYQYCYAVTNGAEANIILTTNSGPNVKPWVDTDASLPSYQDPTPIYTNAARATYYFQDSHTGLHRFGAKGQAIQAHFMAATDEHNYPNTNYIVELGMNNKRNLMYGSTEHQTAVQYTSAASRFNTIVNGQVVTINPGQVYELISVSGAGISGATVALPNGLNASYEMLIVFGGGYITNLVWTGTFDTQTLPPPSTIGGQSSQVTTIRLLYRADVDRWRVVAINQEAPPFINLPSSGAITCDLSSATNFEIVLSGNATIGTPSSPADGGVYTWCVIQDGVGSHTFGFTGGHFKAPGGTIPAVASGANQVTVYAFQYNLFLNAYLLLYSGVNYS